MKFIGGIFTSLNRLENCINHVISSAFIDLLNKNQHKLYFIGSILADEKIFRQFEEKRLMFIRLVETADYIVKSDNINIEFEVNKYKNLAKKIQRMQEIRNDIAHNYILPSTEVEGEYYKQKPLIKLFEEKGKMQGSFVTKKLNLEKIQDECIHLCDEWESLMGEMMEKFANIFNHA